MKKKKTDYKVYVVFGIIIYVLLVFFSFHVAAVYDSTKSNLLEAVSAGMKHMETTPFEVVFNPKAFLIISGVFAFGAFYFYLETQRKKKMRNGEEHGSAGWNTDLAKYNKTYSYPKGNPKPDKTPSEKNRNMILSNEIYLSMNGRDTMRNNNILIVGGSGTGKSRFEVKPNLLQANASFVVTDPKGELLKATGKFLEEQGYEVKLFNLIDFQHSNRYNPFKYIRNDDGVVMMVNTLIKNTNKKGSSGGDPFWEKSETALLQAICFYLYHECNIEDQTFANVMNLLRLAEVKEDQEDFQSTLDIMFENLRERDPGHIAVRQYDIFKMGAGKTLKSILISAAVRLTAFNMQSIIDLTTEDNLNMKEIGDKKTALFVVIPDSDDTFNFLVAIMYSQLFECLYYHADNEVKNHCLDYDVRFMLDEFANIGEIPDFEKKLATMRSRGISCTIIIQNLAQLKTMYKDSWESITGNCDTFVFLGGQEQTTLEYISKKLGKETITTRSTGRSRGKSGSSSMNYQTTGRELMTPDEIGIMDNKNCIVFIRGIKPFFTEKFKYETHPNYKYTEDADSANMYDYYDKFNTTDGLPDMTKENDKELLEIVDAASLIEESMLKHQTGKKEAVPERKTVKSESDNGKELLKQEVITEKTIEEAKNCKPVYDEFAEEEEEYESTFLDLEKEEIVENESQAKSEEEADPADDKVQTEESKTEAQTTMEDEFDVSEEEFIDDLEY